MIYNYFSIIKNILTHPYFLFLLGLFIVLLLPAFEHWGLYFYDISECMEFKKNGFQIVVPRQEKTWCLQDMTTEVYKEIEIEKYKNVFLKEYPIIKNRNNRTAEDLFDFNREEGNH